MRTTKKSISDHMGAVIGFQRLEFPTYYSSLLPVSYKERLCSPNAINTLDMVVFALSCGKALYLRWSLGLASPMSVERHHVDGLWLLLLLRTSRPGGVCSVGVGHVDAVLCECVSV